MDDILKQLQKDVVKFQRGSEKFKEEAGRVGAFLASGLQELERDIDRADKELVHVEKEAVVHADRVVLSYLSEDE